MSLTSSDIRRQFPFFAESDQALVYLDSASTTQKPQPVLRALTSTYEKVANPHRSMYPLAEEMTDLYEGARDTVRAYINAAHSDEIIFTRNATESINLVAHAWARTTLTTGDKIILSIMEHHANIVPWQQLAADIGVELVWIDIDDSGALRMDELQQALDAGGVKLVTITGQSNVTGKTPDIHLITQRAHDAGAKVLIDAAQLIAHDVVDVQNIGCDFLVFSGHKLYGPSGIGVLYVSREVQKTMKPFLGGGMMIRTVTKEGFEPADAPQKFEAGSMPVAEAAGLMKAIEWLEQFPISDRKEYEQHLTSHAVTKLSEIEGLRFIIPINRSTNQPSILSFTIDNIHPHDLTHVLGEQGFCLRAGHHCAQPLHTRLGIPASARISFGLYNTTDEIDALIPALKKTIQKLS